MQVIAEKTHDKVCISFNQKQYFCSEYSFKRILSFAPMNTEVVRMKNYIGIRFQLEATNNV